MSVRLRRLQADYDRMCTFFTGRSRIQILKMLGNPPEKYQVEFLVESLQKDLATGAVRRHSSFIAEIALTGAYPRMAPQCRMLTPVFHPNIAPHAICIGDHWAAGESLPNLVVRIAEMLTFQSYNVKSPLNGDAARWVEENQDKLPLDSFDFGTLLSVGEAVGRNLDGTLKAGTICANCGAQGAPERMHVCVNQHVACDSCVLECPVCHGTICLKCPTSKCAFCGRSVCSNCIAKCRSCGRSACRDHSAACHVCGAAHCADCTVTCDACGKPTCVEHITKAAPGSGKRYLCTICATQASVAP